MQRELKERKLLATNLRKKGFLYSEISKELEVAKSTVYSWLKDMQLSELEVRSIKENLHRAQLKKVKHLKIVNKKIMDSNSKSLREKAKNIVKDAKLSRSHEALLCATLFWCEGGKNIGSGIQFINSDPYMIEVFMKLMRRSFDIDEAKLRALIHLHDYHDINKQTVFWSEVSGIPLNQFYQPYIKPHTGKNKRDGYPGCVSIRYHDAAFGKLLQMIYNEFSQHYRGVR